MAKVTPARIDLQQEELSYRAAISEGTFTRMGSSVNFINERQAQPLTFFLNGPYQKAAGQTGLEGLYVFHFDVEIVAVAVGNIVAGSGGTTTLDVHRLTSSGTDAGSIFSVKPSITTAAPNNAYAISNLIDATSQASAGITLPTLSTTEFDKFDALRVDVDSTMTQAENCFLIIHFRPR